MSNLKAAFIKFPILETTRFLLREVKEQDYNQIYEIYSNDDVVKYQQIKPMETIDQAQKSVIWLKDGFKNKRFIRWCIAEKKTDKVIGLIALHSFDDFNLIAQIGFILNKNYWKQGIMGEVGARIVKYAFEEVKLHRIEALIDKENIASCKLSVKLGFKEEGLKKEAAYNRRTEGFDDRLIYGLLNT